MHDWLARAICQSKIRPFLPPFPPLLPRSERNVIEYHLNKPRQVRPIKRAGGGGGGGGKDIFLSRSAQLYTIRARSEDFKVSNVGETHRNKAKIRSRKIRGEISKREIYERREYAEFDIFSPPTSYSFILPHGRTLQISRVRERFLRVASFPRPVLPRQSPGIDFYRHSTVNRLVNIVYNIYAHDLVKKSEEIYRRTQRPFRRAVTSTCKFRGIHRT